MQHEYWSLHNQGNIAIIRSHAHSRKTLTIDGAAQLLVLLDKCAGQTLPPPVVIEIDVAHAELLEVQQMAEGRPIADWAPWVNVINAIDSYANLTVAAIPRQASCGGLELALAADLRICRSDATLGLFETRMGILPGAGGTQRLPKLIGYAHALEIILSGEPIDGQQAEKIGLAQRTSDDPLTWAIEFAQRCSLNGNNVLISAKRSVLASRNPDASGFRLEGKTFLDLVNQPFAKQRMTEWLANQDEQSVR
jgi:enoyl-CoA hydratase